MKENDHLPSVVVFHIRGDKDGLMAANHTCQVLFDRISSKQQSCVQTRSVLKAVLVKVLRDGFGSFPLCFSTIQLRILTVLLGLL